MPSDAPQQPCPAAGSVSRGKRKATRTSNVRDRDPVRHAMGASSVTRIRAPESPPQSSSTLFENSHGVSVDGSSFQTFSGLNINVNVETGRKGDVVEPESSSGSGTLEPVNEEHSITSHSSTNDYMTGKPPPLPVQRSCDIYYRHLAVKGRGSPLWLPAPNWNLPKEYRRTGISIGDVGRITASGSFDFLFNILLPPDHPVHAGRVPEMFSPLYPPLDLDDVEMQEEFADDSYLASASVEKAQQDGQGSSGLTFETTDSEGAILTIPKGSDSSDLLNLTRFREYLAANVESWYRYTNGQRGREAKNGDLRLVIGWDKATAWGMATFSRSSKAATLFRLDFKPLEQTGRRYKWVYSGMAEGRTGPSTREVAELRRASEPEDVAFANQCLFIRTINHSLSDEVWERLKATKFGTIKSGDSAEYGSSSKAGKLEGKAKSTYAAQNPAGISSVALNQVADSSLTPSLLLHPSTSINEHLLRENPNARIAITEDINWISVLTEDDDSLPLNSHIVQRVLESHDIRTNGGVVYLTPKINDDSNASGLPDGHLLENRMHSTLHDGSASRALERYSQRGSHSRLFETGLQLWRKPNDRSAIENTLDSSSRSAVTSDDGAHQAPTTDPGEAFPTPRTPAGVRQPPMSAQSSAPSWTGWIESTNDALLILEAARRGLIPRVTHRLNVDERKTIASGAVYVFDESHISRWTDSIHWSRAHICGNFLLYRQVRSRSDADGPEPAAFAEHGHTSAFGHPRADIATRFERERMLLNGLPNDKHKADGLIKKTFSAKMDGIEQHLVCYYKLADVGNGRLHPPSSFPGLAALDISTESLERAHVVMQPKGEIGADGISRYRGMAEGDKDKDRPFPQYSPRSAPTNKRRDLLYSGLQARGSRLSFTELAGLSPEYIDPRYRSKADAPQSLGPSSWSPPMREPPEEVYAPYSDPRMRGSRSLSHEFAAVSPSMSERRGVHVPYSVSSPGSSQSPFHEHGEFSPEYRDSRYSRKEDRNEKSPFLQRSPRSAPMNERPNLQALYSDLQARGSRLSSTELAGLSPEYIDPRYRSWKDDDDHPPSLRPSPWSAPIREPPGEAYAPHSDLGVPNPVSPPRSSRLSFYERGELSPEYTASRYSRMGDANEDSPFPQRSPRSAPIRQLSGDVRAPYAAPHMRGSHELAGPSPAYLDRRYRGRADGDEDSPSWSTLMRERPGEDREVHAPDSALRVPGSRSSLSGMSDTVPPSSTSSYRRSHSAGSTTHYLGQMHPPSSPPHVVSGMSMYSGQAQSSPASDMIYRHPDEVRGPYGHYPALSLAHGSRPSSLSNDNLDGITDTGSPFSPRYQGYLEYALQGQGREQHMPQHQHHQPSSKAPGGGAAY